MANTMATCRGGDKSRVKEDHRCGSEWSEGEAATWRTRATVWVGKDGKVEFQVIRDGQKVFFWSLPPED
jgi:hypothetical protein